VTAPSTAWEAEPVEELEARVLSNAHKANEALNLALEALMAIGLHRESFEGRRAIEALRRIRGVMAE